MRNKEISVSINESDQNDESQQNNLAINKSIYIAGQFPKGKIKKIAYSNSSPIEILEKLFSIYMKQNPDYIEKLTGVEECHKYKLYACPKINEDNVAPQKKVRIFTAKETSEGCQRFWCGSNREFNIALNCNLMIKGGRAEKKFLYLEKNFFCTCACCNRPFMDVYYCGVGASNSGKGDFLGSIFNPCNCCKRECEIYLERSAGEGIPDFSIEGATCQTGIVCPCPCETCSFVYFNITNRDKGNIGKITKIFTSCAEEACSYNSNYVSNFPLKLKWKEKAMIIAAMLFTDYRLFNKRFYRSGGASKSGK